uniref:Secretory carrier-associated membrane protein n=1 Tax=Phallusia mammillata TaxID=59560 RepID=A0A6F9DSA5_9ASCI|nr:secretory carrier-associated membrane protein 1-like [Phallusia mammillata]
MGDFDANPFADPFKDGSVTQATSEADKANLDDFNPFANNENATIPANSSAMMQPTNPPDYGTNYAVSAPPVSAPPPSAPVPGHEELLRRQEELERKAEELQRREQQLSSANYNPRANNWPPLPSWFPLRPCFYQDFTVDIPHEFQRTVKMLYYLWMFYVIALFLNVLSSLAAYIGCAKQNLGTGFGLSILWWLLFTPCSLCWYRPAYKAFRSDSSFNFFLFFFMMFFQFCWSVLMCVGIENWGYAGWILAIACFGESPAVGIIVCIQATLFTVTAVFSLLLLKKAHSLYRTTGASFEKAQQEFATGVMKNPGVQTAAQNAASTAVQSSLKGQY